ncbi:MAG: GNAT family protein [Oscillospiraceae bacterium]|nr:GNAT family protein [Oscillospiraceae bacterium]
MKYSELETPRLILRGWRESDLEDLFAYCGDAEVGPAAGWPPHTDKSVSQSVLHHFMEAGDVWAVVERQSRRAIGSIGLHEEKRRENPNCRMLGYALSREWWGRGMMTEAAQAVLRYAFETLCLEMVTVYHYPQNGRSHRVIEKCGFHYEGTLRRGTVRFDGQVLDNICYSLLRTEYEAARLETARR